MHMNKHSLHATVLCCRLSEDAAKFYAAQLSLALGYLHSKAIVFR